MRNLIIAVCSVLLMVSCSSDSKENQYLESYLEYESDFIQKKLDNSKTKMHAIYAICKYEDYEMHPQMKVYFPLFNYVDSVFVLIKEDVQSATYNVDVEYELGKVLNLMLEEKPISNSFSVSDLTYHLLEQRRLRLNESKKALYQINTLNEAETRLINAMIKEFGKDIITLDKLEINVSKALNGSHILFYAYNSSMIPELFSGELTTEASECLREDTKSYIEVPKENAVAFTPFKGESKPLDYSNEGSYIDKSVKEGAFRIKKRTGKVRWYPFKIK